MTQNSADDNILLRTVVWFFFNNYDSEVYVWPHILNWNWEYKKNKNRNSSKNSCLYSRLPKNKPTDDRYYY